MLTVFISNWDALSWLAGLGIFFGMALDLAAFDAVLKEVYEKTIIPLLNSRTRTRNMFKKETGSWEGRYVRYPLNVSRNQGVMFTTENGTLPVAGQQGYVETRIPIRYAHGRIQLSIQTIKHSRTSKGAFKRAMDQEMLGLVRDLSNDLNRAMFGSGKGTLALVNEATPTGDATLILDSPGGVPGATHGNRFLNPGMWIAFINPSNGALRSSGASPGRQVMAVSTDGTNVTLSSAPPTGTADNDLVVKIASGVSSLVVTDTAYNQESNGLLALIDDGTYVDTLNNVSRTTYPIFKSTVISNVGPLSADVLQRGLDVADQLGEGNITAFICHHSVRRAYLTLMEVDRRYAGGDLLSPDAGTKAAKMKDVTFGTIPWYVDKDAPYGILFAVDFTTATRWVEVEGEWADDDGTILLRLTNQDAYEARYRVFENYSLDRPASCVRWEGITANVIVAHVG
jgi:hypothetical protein